MRWSLVFAFCFCLCVLPAFAQEKLTQADIRDLQEQVAAADQQLEQYDSLMSDLDRVANQSSQTGRSRAFEDLDRIQGQAILALEARIGEDYTIQRHGEEVQEVTTQQAENETSGSTSRQKRTVNQELNSQGAASPGYRLVRMQQIYISIQQSVNAAVGKEGDAFNRCYRMAREFYSLMQYDRDEIFDSLPPEAQEEYMETKQP